MHTRRLFIVEFHLVISCCFFQLARVARRPWFSSCWQSQSEEQRVTLFCFVSFSSHHLSQISSQSSPVCRAWCCRQLSVRSLSLCALESFVSTELLASGADVYSFKFCHLRQYAMAKAYRCSYCVTSLSSVNTLTTNVTSREINNWSCRT